MRLICMCVSEKNILLCSHNKLNHIYSNGGGKNFYTALQRWKTCKKTWLYVPKNTVETKYVHYYTIVTESLVHIGSLWSHT